MLWCYSLAGELIDTCMLADATGAVSYPEKW